MSFNNKHNKTSKESFQQSMSSQVPLPPAFKSSKQELEKVPELDLKKVNNNTLLHSLFSYSFVILMPIGHFRSGRIRSNFWISINVFFSC